MDSPKLHLTHPEDLTGDSPEVPNAVVPVLAEQIVVEKRSVATGGVRVKRHITEHNELVEVPLRKEHVDVRRVVVDRIVEGPLPVRREGDVTIIPVVEEVLVVQKHYRLKEEIYVTRTTTEEIHRERVTLRRQEAEIEQLDADGTPKRILPSRVTEPPARPRRRKSILSDD